MRLAGVAEVRFSGRETGDLGRTTDADPPRAIAANRERLRAACGVGGVALGRQVHGATVAAVREEVRGYRTPRSEADGQATSLTGVAVAVHVADCLPIAVAGEGGVVMLHGGWRGLAAGVVPEGVRALRLELGVRGPLAAAIGPGAGGCCYEAGLEVHAAFAEFGASRACNVDLKLVARRQLEAAGVAAVEDVGVCTICGDGFFSHRRGDAGRQAGLAWLS